MVFASYTCLSCNDIVCCMAELQQSMPIEIPIQSETSDVDSTSMVASSPTVTHRSIPTINNEISADAVNRSVSLAVGPTEVLDVKEMSSYVVQMKQWCQYIDQTSQDKKSSLDFLADQCVDIQELVQQSRKKHHGQEELDAIMANDDYRDFYVQMVGRLRNLFTAYRCLASGMVAKGGDSALSILRDVTGNVMDDCSFKARPGATLQKVIDFVQKQVSFIPCSHAVAAAIQLVFSVHDERQQCVMLARVMRILALTDTRARGEDLDELTESTCRLVLRAYGESLKHQRSFGRFQKSFCHIFVLDADSPIKRLGYQAADKVLELITSGRGCEEVDRVALSRGTNTKLSEALAAAVLEVPIPRVRSLRRLDCNGILEKKPTFNFSLSQHTRKGQSDSSRTASLSLTDYSLDELSSSMSRLKDLEDEVDRSKRERIELQQQVEYLKKRLNQSSSHSLGESLLIYDMSHIQKSPTGLGSEGTLAHITETINHMQERINILDEQMKFDSTTVSTKITVQHEEMHRCTLFGSRRLFKS
jgi:hypothetical protein